MAQSRRRERELARRRFERRRLAQLQQQQRRRRRNTTIGSIVGVVVVLGAIVGIGVGVFGSGNSSKSNSSVKTATNPSSSPSTSPTATAVVGGKCKRIQPDPPAKGEPTVPQLAKGPTKLVVKDIKRGHGAVVKSNDSVVLRYVGVACSTGKPFDASYTDGAPGGKATFPLSGVVPGFREGLLNMRVGGVRQIVIPPALGYGASGSQGVAPNETLNFVVTLLQVKSK